MALRKVVYGFALACSALLASQQRLHADDSDTEQLREKVVARAISYLATKGQAEDGSFTRQVGTGVTALVTTSLLRSGRDPDDPVVNKSLQYLLSHVQPDGGIYRQGSRLKNYETCLSLVCLQQANRDGQYDKIIENADKYIRGLQVTEADGKGREDVDFGGATYGGQGRPDLSNTSFLIEALRSAGAEADDPAIQAALVFVSRCQNLESEHNTTPLATKNPDGGFYYTPSGEGASAAEKTPNGGLRSYGSMTYAGLKSMIYAGLGPDDPRVAAATNWIRTHYDLESNPGLGPAGLYYYYHLFAKALDASGQDTLTDAEGNEHDWRSELVQALAQRQREDGSWVNENERWFESDPNLVTSYALLALSYCRDNRPAQ